MTHNAQEQLWAEIADRVNQATKRGADLFQENLIEFVYSQVASGRFESHIEAVFYAWWYALNVTEGLPEWGLCAQREVEISGERFRIDFTVGREGPLTPKVAIELDGHDFHERTKEQATYRNRRDRLLQGEGWKVLHVSGSELVRSPEECVGGVMKVVLQFWLMSARG